MASIKLTGDTSLYWIRLPDHKDIFLQGYIGISSNVEKRFKRHKFLHTNKHLGNAIKKYGWDFLIKEVMLIADEAYCLMIEKLLRAKENIGWNIAIGGGKPPVFTSSSPKSEETKAKISATKTGVKLTGSNLERAKKQIVKVGKNTRFKKGVIHSPEIIQKASQARVGRKLSEETKEKIRQKRLAYWKRIKETENVVN